MAMLLFLYETVCKNTSFLSAYITDDVTRPRFLFFVMSSILYDIDQQLTTENITIDRVSRVMFVVKMMHTY